MLVDKKLHKFSEKDFIDFLTKQGITVKTNTKARGNLGICYKNRIDLSKKAPENKRMAILAHEYAHVVHLSLEKDSFRNGGSLERLFDIQDIEAIRNELIRVTHFVDENSLFLNFEKRKEEITNEIKELEKIIKKEYPDFKRSQDFKPIKSFLRKNKSNIKYLLKYDRVKLLHPITRKEEFLSIKTIDEDFSEVPEALRAYIKLNSLQREQRRLSQRKNKVQKYYTRPTELFARFVEGLFIDAKMVELIAPKTFNRFLTLVYQGHYGELKNLLAISVFSDIGH